MVDPFEAAIIREIFSLFLSGNSINGIAARMAEKYGKVRNWNGTTVRRVLGNPICIGKVRQNGELFDGLHEPIISETDFYMANAILVHNKEVQKQSCRSTSLLTGLLYCGDCGARMQPRRITRGYDLRRYVCYSVSRTSKAMIRSDHCTNRLHPYTQEELDEIIINEIRKLAVDEEYVKSIIQEDSGPKVDEAELFQDRLKEVQTQMDKLLNLYQIGVLDLADIEDRIADLKHEKETLQKSLEGASTSVPLDIQKVQSYASAFETAYQSGNTEYINRMIRLLIDKIVVLNADIEIHWTFC